MLCTQSSLLLSLTLPKSFVVVPLPSKTTSPLLSVLFESHKAKGGFNTSMLIIQISNRTFLAHGQVLTMVNDRLA